MVDGRKEEFEYLYYRLRKLEDELLETKVELRLLKEQFKREMKNPENALTASAINNGKMDIYSMIQSLLSYYVKI